MYISVKHAVLGEDDGCRRIAMFCIRKITMPKRIQRRRTKNFRLPPHTKCCTRPGFWSNPFTGRHAVQWFRFWLLRFPDARADTIGASAQFLNDGMNLDDTADPDKTGNDFLSALGELDQYDFLACYCPLGRACHVDVLLHLLEELRNLQIRKASAGLLRKASNGLRG